MRTPRRRAREFIVQGLYSWQLTGNDTAAIQHHIAELEGYGRADAIYCQAALSGTIQHAPELIIALTPHLDRPWQEISPVERAILLLACYELTHQPDIPHRAVLNEAIEVSKVFGGLEGHKFINGILDKLVKR